MAVESTMVPLGTSMPEFALKDVDGHEIARPDLAGAPALVMFLCNHCHYLRPIEARSVRCCTSSPIFQHRPATIGACGGGVEPWGHACPLMKQPMLGRCRSGTDSWGAGSPKRPADILGRDRASKVWLADRAEGVFGGVYMFESEKAVDD